MKESVQKYSEKGEKLVHQRTLEFRNEMATMKSCNPMTDASIGGNINKCGDVTAVCHPASMFIMQTFKECQCLFLLCLVWDQKVKSKPVIMSYILDFLTMSQPRLMFRSCKVLLSP